MTRYFLSLAFLLSTTTLLAEAPPDPALKITLETNPSEVCAKEEFELTCRVSVENAQVEEVFLDCTSTFGPEYTWEPNGGSVFESTVRHIEAESGLKEYELWAKINKGEASRFVGQSFKVNVATKDGDQDLKDFLAWMKELGYSDEIIQVYAHDGANPVVREKWNKYFDMRKDDRIYRELKTMPIVFVDILATEEEATNESLKGELAKLDDYMTRIFGKSFEIEYLEMPVSYEEQFGKPMLQENDAGRQWLKFNPAALNKFARDTAKRLTEEHQLPPNAVIIHWAPDKWMYDGKDLKVQDHTGSSPALSGMDFGLYGVGIYAHEWGHGLGLGHMFVTGPGSYTDRAWGLECIMNHTYVAYSNQKVGRLLSPLPRYALEPKNGYLDQQTFAATYSEAMAGTEHLERRLSDIQNGETTVVSTMAWSTPWKSDSEDSVICEGLKNRSFEVKNLKLESDLEPGTYSLFIDETPGSGPRRTAVLRKDGEEVASAYLMWLTRISHEEHYELSFKDYLSLSIGRSNKRGGSTLAGVGKLLNEKPLVVSE